VRRYGILYFADLCVVAVVCCFASVWGTVFWGVCVMLLWCDVVRRYGVLFLGCLCIVTVVCCCA